MSYNKLPEVWLRGPLPGMPALLQPVAHALLQVREELNDLMAGFPDEMLWNKVAGMASPGFHLQHLTGVLDRLFTYTKGKGLSQVQLDYLSKEGKTAEGLNTLQLVSEFSIQVDKALLQLAQTNIASLTEVRFVGRAQVPSTMMGLYVHAAEHTTRHFGQLLVSVKVLKSGC